MVLLKGKVVTHEYSWADCARKAEALVIRVPDSDRESTSKLFSISNTPNISMPVR
jgi:hypothetical protein